MSAKPSPNKNSNNSGESSKPSPEIIVSFVEDAREQIAAMKQSIKAYRKDPSEPELLDDAVRLTHSIKGAASMIGLPALGHIAYFQQEILQSIRDENRKLSGKTSATVTQMVDTLSSYVTKLARGKLNERQMLTKVVVSYRRFNKLPADRDSAQIEQLLRQSNIATDSSPTSKKEPTKTNIGQKASDEQAERKDDTRREDEFREEASEHARKIASILPNYESGTQNTECANEILRHLHSLKGAAAITGFQQIADLSHKTEDLLVGTESGSINTCEATIQLLSRCIDSLSDQIEERSNAEETSTLIAEINELLDDSLAIDPASETESFAGVAAAEPVVKTAETSELRESISAQLGQRETIADDLLEVFTEEAEDHIKLIYAALSALTEDTSNPEPIQEVRRSAHTLKGASGAVGLQIVTQLSHRMEDLLDEIYNKTQPVTSDTIALLLATTDTLHDLCAGEIDQETIAEEIVKLHQRYATLLGTKEENDKAIELVGPAMPIDFSAAQADQSDETKQEPSAQRAKKQESGQVLRVPIERLDDLVRTASELIINRTSFEQRMAHFSRYVEELQLVLERMRGISHEMDMRHSIDALRDGFGNADAESSTRDQEFDSLEFDRYTGLHLLSRSLGEATSDINTVAGELRTLIGDFDSLLDRQGRLARETQDKLMQVRMVPLATLATRLHRAVRVVATKQGKPVELLIDGQDIELDKTVLEEIADPLLHVLRNAVDHGVEPTAVRTVNGKPEQATIRIRAFHQGTQVVIKIADDGGGLDPDRIRARIISGGYASAEEAESFSNEELFPHIFLPGFSTALQVSEVSGRGVGLDVVREKVQKLKGTVRVESEPNKGTTFTVRLPMTLAVTHALMVQSANEEFAIPMQSVVQLVRINREEIDQLGGEPMVKLAGQAYPLIDLADHLELSNPADKTSSSVPVLIMRSGDQQIALVVDKILTGRDIVIKTLGSHLRHVPGLIGATLMGDGRVVPILDPAQLVSDSKGQPQVRVQKPEPKPATRVNTNLNIMIVDDSVSVRRVMKNMIHNAGWIPTTAKDGADALDTLRCIEHPPDAFLVDIEMPTMDGYELLSTLRGQPQFRETPIVMVTSRSGDKHRQKAMNLGASDYVVKPFQDEQLVALIRRLTQNRELVRT